MWEWQRHFRISVQTTIERSLELIDVRLDPRVLLVGFAEDASRVRHPICIEPESGPLAPGDLLGVPDRSTEIFDADPERLTLHSDPGLHESRQEWIRRRARGAAIAEAIHASGTMPGKRIITSSAGRVADYEVHTCVAVDADTLDALPQLKGEEVNGFPAPGSFVGYLMDLIMREADAALDQREPGMGALRRRAEDLVAQAAEWFAAGCSFRTRNFMTPWVSRPVTQISQRTYEGTAAVGRLILAHPDHSGIEVATRFADPIALESYRAVRKLLETTDDNLALLVHEHGVLGLCRIVDHAEDLFEITVTSHATWELSNCGVGLLRFSYGSPTLPTPVIDTAGLADAMARVLGDRVKLDTLLPLVSTAAGARRGTTLVISTDASSEAERLGGQATRIEPGELTQEMLAHYSEIDGAVLVDPEGTCFAIGVILDGSAAGEGDPARGARFNSAVRYQRSASAPTVVIVVSEDGDVVHVPSLRPRVHRQDVIDAVTTLEEAARTEERSGFSDAYEALRALAFYLSPAQCELVNGLITAEHNRSLELGGITIVRSPFAPNPEMNESYWLD